VLARDAEKGQTVAGLLDRERIIAEPGFNRWLVPPAALAIHLSIGMAYGFSVFWLPLSRAVGVKEPIPYPDDMPWWECSFSPVHDWPLSMLTLIYTLFFVFLGGAAAVFGPWVERVGPRKAGVVAACCWGGGLALSALGIYVHQIVLLWLGAGVIGGIGLGLGYISPVSTLIKWFPDRRGLATGLAIMGFGGGAMIGAPLADRLMKEFSTSISVGVWETFLTLAVVYFVAMMLGAFGYRLPPSSTLAIRQTTTARGYVPVSRVHHTPQFWLLWGVLCLNVSAGIGILAVASPMLQEVFGGRLIGVDAPLAGLTTEQKEQVATVGAAFTSLLSLCNIVGRIVWSSVSDAIGRKATYTIFFIAGTALYALAPQAGNMGGVLLFVALFCVILTMYGGGFATIPAYLSDEFGAQQISAIHGRLLTAWSVAGVLGPVAVTSLREWQLARDVPVAQTYNVTLYVLATLLLGGLVCNLLVRPVKAMYFQEPDQSPVPPATTAVSTSAPSPQSFSGRQEWLVALAWLAVLAPLGWSLWITFAKVRVLFH